MGAVRLPKILVLTIDRRLFVGAAACRWLKRATVRPQPAARATCRRQRLARWREAPRFLRVKPLLATRRSRWAGCVASQGEDELWMWAYAEGAPCTRPPPPDSSYFILKNSFQAPAFSRRFLRRARSEC